MATAALAALASSLAGLVFTPSSAAAEIGRAFTAAPTCAGGFPLSVTDASGFPTEMEGSPNETRVLDTISHIIGVTLVRFCKLHHRPNPSYQRINHMENTLKHGDLL